MNLPVQSCTLLENYDQYHSLVGNVNGNKEDERYIGRVSDIGKLEIGQTLQINFVKRYEGISFVKNTMGAYKFVDIAESKQDNIPFLFFVNNLTNEYIEVSLNEGDYLYFNFGVIGENYDLYLVPYYKGLEFKQNIPQNKNCLNTEILIVSKRAPKHYLSIYNGNTILLSTEYNLEPFVGTTVLFELYPKYLAFFIQIGNTFYPPINDNFTLGLCKSTEKLASKYNSSTGQMEDFYFQTISLVPSINIGKTINVDYYPIKFGLYNTFKLSENPCSGYELLTINQDGKLIFRNVQNSKDVFAVIFLFSLGLANNLGQVFEFTFIDFFTLININSISKVDNGNFCLVEIYKSNNIKVFVKNNIKIAVQVEDYEIAPSSLGKYFDLKLNQVRYSPHISNVF